MVRKLLEYEGLSREVELDRDWDRRNADIADLASDWLWQTDSEHRLCYLSERLRSIIGVDPGHFTGTRHCDHMAEAVDPETLTGYAAALAARKPFRNVVYATETPSGLHYVRISGNPVFDAAGNFMGYRGIGTRLTPPMRTPRQPSPAEQRLIDAVESLPVGLSHYDADDRLVVCNTAYKKLFPEIAYQMVPGIRFVDHARAMAEAGLVAEAEGRVEDWVREQLEVRSEKREGVERQLPGQRWVLTHDHRTEEGETISVHSDITGIKRREEALRQLERRFELAFRYNPEMTSISDIDSGEQLHVNDKWVETLGWSREEAIGKTAFELEIWANRADRRRFVQQLKSQGRVCDFEAQLRTKSGSLCDCVINGVILPLEGKSHLMLFAQDVTDRKRTERALIAAKEEAEIANRAKSEFLANMSHELRTPLNAILGFSHMIRDGSLGEIDNGKYREYAEDILASGEHLLGIIDDILALAKAEAAQTAVDDEDVDIRQLVTVCLRLIRERARAAGVALAAEIGDALPLLRADQLKLKQILINLLSNAIKFTNRGGAATVTAAIDDRGGFVLAVRDNGIGMKGQDIPLALEPFHQVDGSMTRRHEGTGLGLPLAKALCELHGATLELESAPGAGTTVTIRFPPERTKWQETTAHRRRSRR